jgi:hypothetical protein
LGLGGFSVKVGTRVQWKWLGRVITGKVKEVFFESVSRKIKGKVIKRNGTREKPAYLVESEAGNLALKLESELQVFKKEKGSKKKPTMFG